MKKACFCSSAVVWGIVQLIFSVNTQATDVSITRSGAGVSYFNTGYANYHLNSNYDGGIVLGEDLTSSEAVYEFYVPGNLQTSQLLTSITVTIHGSGTITTLILNNTIIDNVSGTYSRTLTGSDIYPLGNYGDPVHGDVFRVYIYVLFNTFPYVNDRYDLEKIEFTYTYPGADATATEHYHTAYSGYNAIHGFRAKVIDQTWDIGNYQSDDVLKKAVQETGSLCQNLLDFDGNIYDATKAFLNALDNFHNLADLIYDGWDWINFWGFYPTTGPTVDQVKTACNEAATACAELAVAYQSKGFDGTYTSTETADMLTKLQNALSKLTTLQNRLSSAAQDMQDKYTSGNNQAKVAKQSMGPLMRYADESLQLLDSYLPQLISDIQAQQAEFPPPSDTTPPTPNPMTWATEPYETSTGYILMVATTASDPTTPINYYFDYYDSPTGGSGGTDSSWQSDTSYSDSGLSTNHQYGYRVKAKDGSGNETSYSSVSYDYTDIETPSGVTFGTITSTSIQVKSTNTPSGLDRGNSGLYITEELPPPGQSSGWKQNNDYWTCSGLMPNHYTRFRIKARNGDGDETSYCPTASRFTLANQPGISSFSNITTDSIQANWTFNENSPETDYFCENITTGQNSGWVYYPYSWNNTGLSSGTNYSFRVKARNSEGIETAWTDLGSISTYTPSIAINKPSIDMELFAQDVTFDIWNDVPGTLGYDVSISEGDTYFSVSPSSGTSTGSSDKKTHTIHVNRVNILPGQTVIGKVMITASEANNSPQYIDLSASKIEFTLSGSGTESDPYLIYTAEQLNTIGLYPDEFDKHYKLMADVNVGSFTGTEFNIIGSQGNPFTGFFNGNGHIISNFTWTSSSGGYIGLFGYVSNSGEIRNLGLEDASIGAGNGTYVGSLVGVNEGTVSNCYVTGNVSGDSGVGGLIGYNCGTMSSCYSTTSISGVCTAGGLVGGNWLGGEIFNCYATGIVLGDWFVGGLVGYNENVIYDCYSVGLVTATNNYFGGLVGSNDGSVINSFWDIETSGQSSSSGGEGKTTAEMMLQTTFNNWDFDYAWDILEGQTYPFLTGNIHSNTFYVDDDAVSDPGPHDPNISDPMEDGSKIHPFDSIQEAINVANPHDIIIVELGTYTGNGNRDIEIRGKTLSICSTDPCDPNVVASTIIDCNGAEAQLHRGFYIKGMQTICISGLTIINGESTYGGAICNMNSETIIRNCMIRNNIAEYGGGVYFSAMPPPIFWWQGQGPPGGETEPHPPYLSLDLIAGESKIESCIIAENSAIEGGGIDCPGPSNVLVINSLIAGNIADYGGGIHCGSTDTEIVNSTIAGNVADIGGGIYCNSPEPTNITNCIFWGNIAPDGHEIALASLEVPSGPPPWDTNTPPTTFLPSTLTISYSDVQGGEAGVYSEPNCILNWGLGNIYADPCFVQLGYWDANGTPEDVNDDFWVDGDYHLKSEGWRWDRDANQWTWDEVTSRCIDAGNPGSPLADEPLILVVDPLNRWGQNLRIDMGFFGGTTEASMPPYDWAILGDLTNDGLVDLKDYAFQATDWLNSADRQPGDLNRDSLVDISDLALLVEDWLKQTTWHE